jgi:ATP-binding cassette, subfamily B, bacterial
MPEAPERPRKVDEQKPAVLLRRLLALSWQYRRQCIAVFVYQLLLLVLGVAALGLSGLAIDVTRHALQPSSAAPRFPLGLSAPPWSAPQLLLAVGALVLVLALTRAVLNYRYALTAGELMQMKLVPELRTRVFDKLQRLSFRFFDQNASGSIFNRVTGDVQSVRSFVDGVLIQGAIMLLSLGAYLLYMLRTHAALTGACLALTPLLWLATNVFARWAAPVYRKNRELSDRMVLAMSEGVSGIQVTKVFGREQPELERFEEHNALVRDQQRAIFVKVSRFGPTIDYIAQANIGVLLLYGGYLVSHRAMSLGDLIVFAGLLQQFSAQVSSMAGEHGRHRQHAAAELDRGAPRLRSAGRAARGRRSASAPRDFTGAGAAAFRGGLFRLRARPPSARRPELRNRARRLRGRAGRDGSR